MSQLGTSSVDRKHLVRGFTLIELMVVLSVVAILGALLSRALHHTKSRAHQIGCLANMRQLQVSWFLYADDNGDRLPLNRSEPSRNEQVFGRRNTASSWVAGNPKEDVSTDNIVVGTLFPYTKSASLYRCPSDRSMVIGRNVLRTRSYSASAYMNGDRAGLDPRVKTTYASIANPGLDNVFVFIEEHESSDWMGSFAVNPKEKLVVTAPSWTSLPSDRHRTGCNITFADGHVEYWRWFSADTAALSSKPVLNKLELRDLSRLQDSIPRP